MKKSLLMIIALISVAGCSGGKSDGSGGFNNFSIPKAPRSGKFTADATLPKLGLGNASDCMTRTAFDELEKMKGQSQVVMVTWSSRGIKNLHTSTFLDGNPTEGTYRYRQVEERLTFPAGRFSGVIQCDVNNPYDMFGDSPDCNYDLQSLSGAGEPLEPSMDTPFMTYRIENTKILSSVADEQGFFEFANGRRVRAQRSIRVTEGDIYGGLWSNGGNGHFVEAEKLFGRGQRVQVFISTFDIKPFAGLELLCAFGELTFYESDEMIQDNGTKLYDYSKQLVDGKF